MEARRADEGDLAAIIEMYEDIVALMHDQGFDFWDEVYPFRAFPSDIADRRFYVMEHAEGTIAAAFALSESNPGDACVAWSDERGRACYLDRLGVAVDSRGVGWGGAAIEAASDLARERGCSFLRLFVVDVNEPARFLYERCGFVRVRGTFVQRFEDGTSLLEYAYEKNIR